MRKLPLARLAAALIAAAFAASLPAAEVLPGTQPLTLQGDLSAQMVAGIDKFLDREIETSVAARAQYWKRGFTSRDAYEKSVAPNRERLRKIIGAVDARLPVRELEFVSSTPTSARLAEAASYDVFAVRWPVFDGVCGEGLLLQPKTAPVANIIALPDADQTPEQLAGLAPGIAPESQFARRLAEQGCRVIVPALVSRDDTWSGSDALNRRANLPHREWLWRMAWELGRHPIGYEAQKVLALADWFAHNSTLSTQNLKLGLAGYGEGALIALYAAALDPRIDATLVSGCFDSRQRVWTEPQYRNVWSLLKEFGDAELASLITPRALIVEHSDAPKVNGPPKPRDNRRSTAAPGKLATLDFPSVEAEVERARHLAGKFGETIRFVHGAEGILVAPGSNKALMELLAALGQRVTSLKPGTPPSAFPGGDPDLAAERQHRAVKQLEDFTQGLLQNCERARAANFWNTIKATNAAAWEKLLPKFKLQFEEDVIGRFTNASLPLNPRSRPAIGTNGLPLTPSLSPSDGERDGERGWTAWDVTLDVFPDVFAWGVLLLPKDLKPGERRPVVVCEHGLEGLPESTITDDQSSRAYASYKAFSARLTERGFVVFAPHNPYRGGDAFRVLQRKANLLGKTLFSVINAQHERILDWLGAQPFVDAQRIAFYGLSYGGKSAMRIPAVHDRYCLSICSGDLNEWVRKNAATDYPGSYLYSGEYEIFEWDLGHTFNYAEMAALIAPRPFMVERGHSDGVGVDEWVAYEYAKVRRFYDQLGLGDRTGIEFFNGPHTINGQGTFEFLHKHLDWPRP